MLVGISYLRSCSTSGSNDQYDAAAAPRRSASRCSLRRRRPSPVKTQTAVRQAQMRVVAELIKAKMSRGDVAACTNEVDVVFLPAAVTALVELSSIPPCSNNRRSVDSSTPPPPSSSSPSSKRQQLPEESCPGTLGPVVLHRLLTTWRDQRSYSTPDSDSPGMGDRIGVQLPIREIYLSLTNHPNQLRMAILPWVGAMSTAQRAVMLYG